MRIRSRLTAGLIIYSALTILATPVQSGIILIGGEGGTSDPPAPTQGTQTEENWNPTVTCSVGEGQGILDLLTCLENEISNPPPACGPIVTGPTGNAIGPKSLQAIPYPEPCYPYPDARSDFNVWVLTPPPNRWGIEIRALDGTEIKRISLRENDPGIQTTELQLNAAWRVARVRLVGEQPTGTGAVYLTVNDTVVTVPTGGLDSPLEVNLALMTRLVNTPFTVTLVGDYLQIRSRKLMGTGIRRIQFRSTDPGIVSSDLGLLTEGDLMRLMELEVTDQL